MLTDPTPDPDIDSDREAAFQAPERTWTTQNLQPFSISRRAYFLAWRTALQLPSMSVILSTDTDAFLSDALRLLWLSLQQPNDLEDLRAQGFSAMQTACDDWANANVSITDLPAIILTGLRIWNGAHVTRHVADVDPDLMYETPGKPLPSPKKKPSTSPSSPVPQAGQKIISAGSYPSVVDGLTTTPNASMKASAPRGQKP